MERFATVLDAPRKTDSGDKIQDRKLILKKVDGSQSWSGSGSGSSDLGECGCGQLDRVGDQQRSAQASLLAMHLVI
jgi:hypothetical protein